MGAPAVLRDVFHAHRAGWGEEDDGILFENGRPPIDRLDILVYRPAPGVDLTAFTTIGMAAEPMPNGPGPGTGGRAELQFSRRGALSHDDEHAIARQLANIATYPFSAGVKIDWGHLVPLPGEFPTMPGCTTVLLSGPLTPTGRDYLDTCEGKVRILNVLPITDEERALGRTLPPITFVQTLLERVDVFAPRPTP